MTARSESEPPHPPRRPKPGAAKPGAERNSASARPGPDRASKPKRPGKPLRPLPKRESDDDAGDKRLPLKWLTRGRDVLILQEPFCARERLEDIQEVHRMIEGDEPEIARDELLYLVSDCRGFFDAHNLLGRLAADEGNLPVARGHYGFVYESVLKGLPHGFRGRLPSSLGYNGAIFAGGHGLARVLVALGELEEAGLVLKRLESFDPDDAATRELREEWDELSKGGDGAAPLVQLQLAPKPPAPRDEPR